MIVPSDKDYKETKLIKQGKASLNPYFKPLAGWIEKNYNVKVLNIYYDITTGAYNNAFPRLNIIFEHWEDQLKFRDSLGNFDSDRQKAIAKKFDELVNGNKQTIPFWSFIETTKPKYDTYGLLVIFSSFKPIARDEANESIPQPEIDAFKTNLNNPEVWGISRFGAGVTTFFYTQEQADSAKSNNYLQLIADKYFEILKQYDEFNYFDRQTFSISVDSKENFDKNYQSSWFYYYR